MRRLHPLLLLLGLVACDPANEIHVDPGSRADSLILHAFQLPDSLDGTEWLYNLTVATCPSASDSAVPVWQIERRGASGRNPNSVSPYFRYGQRPRGDWTTVRGPLSLHAGCYAADVQGGGISGYTRFVVDSTGRITPLAE